MSAGATLNSALFTPGLYRNILQLWFKNLPLPTSTVLIPVRMQWYGHKMTPEARALFDSQCASTARDALESIGPGPYPLPLSPESSPETSQPSKIAEPFLAQIIQSQDPAPEETALAMMLLLDQLPRNCFRDNQKLVYNHYDRISRSVLHEILHRGLDGYERYQDSPPWRLWYYKALARSEDLRNHRSHMAILSIVKRRMQQKRDGAAVRYVEDSVRFEKRYIKILKRFGRYPHRNQVLGRESTAEEKQYLENGWETFRR